MNREEIIQLIKETVEQINAERSISSLNTPHHTHNGVDSPLLNNAPQTLPAVPVLADVITALQKLNLIK